MKYIIVTPIWKEKLDVIEYKFVKTTSITNQSVPRVFLYPDDLDLSYYKNTFPDWIYKKVEKYYLSSISSYNRLMMLEKFYLMFNKFEFIVICQTDAVLIKNITTLKLKNIDYVGAPWSPPKKMNYPNLLKLKIIGKLFEELGIYETLKVGNGGLSIRRVKTFISLTKEIKFKKFIKENEDKLFSYLGKKGKLQIICDDKAKKIFQEKDVMHADKLPDIHGFHAIDKWNSSIFDQLLIKIDEIMSERFT